MRVVAVLIAYRPSSDWPEQSIALWAQSIQRFEMQDALEAARILGEGGRWTPVLADFLDAIRDCQNVRQARERVALPPAAPPTYYPFALFLHENGDAAERVKALEATAFHHEVKGAENAIVPTLAEILSGEMPETKEEAR